MTTSITAAPVPIKWHSGLPVYASESFLKSVSDEYGWLGGTDASGNLRCVLPYTIVRKAIFRLVRFRVETIPIGEGLDVAEEKSFLNSVVEWLKGRGADVIIPATTNTIFRTYPDGADAAPYGSYVIDLTPPEDALWRNIGRIYRQNIGTAQKGGVTIRPGPERLREVHELIADTFKRSELPFMSYESLQRFVEGLGENGLVSIAEHEGKIHSCVIFGYSKCCAYAIYAGNLANQHQGSNKLIYWDAIRSFKQMGVQRFDFVGARVNPDKGSKQEAINLFKQRFGAKLIQGYLWKKPLHPVKALAYTLGVRLLRGGDIVDHERHKMASIGNGTVTTMQPGTTV